MPYTKFAFFSYRCATVVNSEQGDINQFWPQLGDTSDIARVINANRDWIELVQSDDGKTRVLKTLIILDEARRWVDDHYYGEPNTLKIFVIPEFYFRPPTADIDDEKRYTEYDGYNIHLSLLRALDDPIFNHWVIVPGTVVSTAQLSKTNFTTNIGILIEGGTNNYIRVAKHHTSGEDKVDSKFQGDDPNNFSLFEYKRYLIDNTDLFLSVGGKTFGLEICKDYSEDLAVLKHTVADQKDQPKNQEIVNGLDFHLLTAAGMNINPTAVAAKTNGYIFRLDGYKLLDSHLTLRKVERQVFEDVYRYSKLRTDQYLKEAFYDVDSFGTKKMEAFLNTY